MFDQGAWEDERDEAYDNWIALQKKIKEEDKKREEEKQKEIEKSQKEKQKAQEDFEKEHFEWQGDQLAFKCVFDDDEKE